MKQDIKNLKIAVVGQGKSLFQKETIKTGSYVGSFDKSKYEEMLDDIEDELIIEEDNCISFDDCDKYNELIAKKEKLIEDVLKQGMKVDDKGKVITEEEAGMAVKGAIWVGIIITVVVIAIIYALYKFFKS